MRRIFTFFTLFPVIAIIVLSPKKSVATHVAGSELIYEWLRDSTYRFYFKFFDDCSGNYPALSEFDLCYYNPCNGFNGSVKIKKMTLLPGNIPNGTPVATGCPGVTTTCESWAAQVPGFREWWYMADVPLPSRCDSWLFSVSVNARNASQNLVNANNYNLYIEATLNNLDSAGFRNHNLADFSSPYFSLKPVPYICLNTPMSYSGGPQDPDGDVLTYEFITPRHIGGINMGANCQPAQTPGQHTYVTPYNLQNPFASNSTFMFDSATSVMTFTPSALGKNTVSVRVNKFRNGVKLGSVMRDIQFQVITCNTSPLKLNVIPTTVTGARYLNDRIEACAGMPFRFCYKVTSNLANTILVVEDDHQDIFPGSSAIYNNMYKDSVLACISWTPADTGLRLLTIIAKDSTCRAPGVIVPQTYVIPVYVRPPLRSFQQHDICLGDTLTLSSNGTTNLRWSVLPGGSDASSLSCTSCSNPVARPSTTTTYVAGYASVNTCGIGDTIAVYVTENTIKLTPAGPLVFCTPDSLYLEASATGPKPYASAPCGVTTAIPASPADTTDIRVLSGNLQNNHNPGSSPFNGAYTTARHQYLIRAADMKHSGMHAGRLGSLSFYVSTAVNPLMLHNLNIALKCTTDSLDVTGKFQTGAMTVYTSTGPLMIPAGAGWKDIPFDTYYEWDGESDLLIDICYSNPASTFPAYTGFYQTGYYATMYVYDYGGSVCSGGGGLNGIGILTAQLPQIRFGWHGAPEKDFIYRWTGSAFISDTTDRQRVSTLVSGTTQIIVSAEGRNGCVPSDTLDIYLSEHGYTVHPDTTICEGNSAALFVRDTVSPASAFDSRWYEQDYLSPVSLSCDRCTHPVARPSTETLYTIVVTDSVECADTLQTLVKVDPFVQVEIDNNDTLIGYGEQLQLSARGADRYLWSPGHGLSNTQISNPLAKPDYSIVYTVTATKGVCTSYDSVQVRVDLRGLIFIPNAFTPNGDGVNDIFRIGNFTFQRVKEFRIFNRWGEEIFSTLNGRNGWDGLYKGVPQETGTYHYLIRIGFPDGNEELYKGDMTLIR